MIINYKRLNAILFFFLMSAIVLACYIVYSFNKKDGFVLISPNKTENDGAGLVVYAAPEISKPVIQLAKDFTRQKNVKIQLNFVPESKLAETSFPSDESLAIVFLGYGDIESLNGSNIAVDKNNDAKDLGKNGESTDGENDKEFKVDGKNDSKIDGKIGSKTADKTVGKADKASAAGVFGNAVEESDSTGLKGLFDDEAIIERTHNPDMSEKEPQYSFFSNIKVDTANPRVVASGKLIAVSSHDSEFLKNEDEGIILKNLCQLKFISDESGMPIIVSSKLNQSEKDKIVDRYMSDCHSLCKTVSNRIVNCSKVGKMPEKRKKTIQDILAEESESTNGKGGSSVSVASEADRINRENDLIRSFASGENVAIAMMTSNKDKNEEIQETLASNPNVEIQKFVFGDITFYVNSKKHPKEQTFYKTTISTDENALSGFSNKTKIRDEVSQSEIFEFIKKANNSNLKIVSYSNHAKEISEEWREACESEVVSNILPVVSVGASKESGRRSVLLGSNNAVKAVSENVVYESNLNLDTLAYCGSVASPSHSGNEATIVESKGKVIIPEDVCTDFVAFISKDSRTQAALAL